jgi:hypothetical protein
MGNDAAHGSPSVFQTDRMKILLALAAVGEAATGLVLLVYPPSGPGASLWHANL